MKLNFTEKVKCTALFITIVLCSFGSFAQSSITPSGNVSVGQTVTYNVQDDVIYSDYYWTADLGNVLSSWRSGITYYAQVEWTSAGASSLNFYANGGLLVYATITVVCPGAPATPTPTFSADANSCAPRLISYTGTPPGGVTWYWQTSTDGMDMSYAGNTYSVYSSQGLYVRARNNSSGCWSSGSAFYSATVSSTPSYPSNPTVSTNTCGAKTLTRGTPPAGVTWYWQGTTSMGTSTANSATTFTASTTGYYYLRAQNNSTGCWSSAQGGASVTINDPPQPPTPSTTSYSCGPQTLTVAGTPPANTTWYWQGTNANGTSTANPYTTNYSANTSGNNNYYLRAYNTLQGCWSQASSSVNATVSSMPQTPYATLTVSTNLCGSKTVTISGTPPFNEVWHWQGLNASGTSINSNPTQVVTSSGTYYLRSLYMPSGCWSTNSQSVTVTVNDPPADPSVPTTTNNSCGSQTLSFTGTPPAGVTWYWQGTNANGTSMSYSASTYLASVSGANTYYLRAYSGSCWSTNSASVSATVASIAQTPYATITISSNTCGPKTITISGTPPLNEVWHWQDTNPAGTTINSSTTVGAPTSGTYYLRSLYMPSGCWSTNSQSFTITVNDPPTPATPTTTTAACGPQTLSKTGSAPANVAWYWQGTNSAGIDFTSPQATGVTYSAPLSGTYFLRARNTLGCWSPASTSVAVSVNVIPSAPSVPTVSTNTCDAKTLTRVNPADGSIWYWQGNVPNGTSQANSATSFLASVTGTNPYYLRALKSGCWSVQTQVNVTVTPTPAPPPVPVADINTCESKTLTKPTAPPGVSFFWQGVNAGTTDYTSATAIAPTFEADASTTYYLRAKANAAACWSASTPIIITVNPVNISVSSYDQTNPNIQATSTIKLLPGVVVTAGKPFSAKIVISAECNNLVNWNEQTVYNETGTPISITRTYSDGFGNPLESQTKDFLSNKVFGSQSIFNSQGVPVASSLAAPLLETDFIYKKNLATNASGATYGPNDFDARTITGAQGEINNPKPFGTQPGTVGWYYSSSNTLEPLTPTTQYPYSRTYVPEGPDPTVSTSAGPGDQHRMGSGHEVKSERQLITPGELNHYYSLRSHFVSTPASWGTNLLSHISTNTTTGFTAYQNVTLSSAGGYLNVTCNQATSTPGIWPIGGTLNVTANKRYVFSAKGYKSSDASPVYLYVRTGTSGANIVWLGALIPTGAANEKWVSSPFLVPAGVTQITVGMLWATAAVGSTLSVNGIELRPETPDLVGYKQITTDPNGKRAVSFSDADGRGLASATITSAGGPPYTYDNWSYTYYNDAGQVVASVAPKGVNTASTALPNFVTYFKYDHLGRMIETTSPDEGTSRFVYTLDGRIRFSENQVQRTATPKRFSYTNYDYLGRLIESGEYTSTGTNPFLFEPHSTITPASASVLNIIEQVGFSGITRTLDPTRCKDHSFIQYDTPASVYEANLAPSPDGDNLTGYGSYSGLSTLSLVTSNNETYIRTRCNQAGTGPGMWTNTAIPVVAGEKYRFMVKGYSITNLAYLFLEYNGEPVTYGPTLPIGASQEGTIVFEFTVPAGKTIMKYGVRWGGASLNEDFFVNYISMQKAIPLATTQSYLIGQVSKTENENATTWYSYDEFGQLTWMKQNIIGLGIKTVDYTYDYFGNVTQVAYQAGQSDKFYHHYEYDLNQRLTHTYTSLDGTNKTLHAKYLYYLHGPLKRVELATNLQGIDYVYTINGALKSINHSDLARDPGSDGSNGFSTDVFGQVFDYYDNDYAGAGYSAGSVTATGLTNQYNGLIKDITWVTPVDNMGARKAYGYTYDNLYQLQNAQFGTVTGLSGNYTANLSATNYNESIPGYDKNGNILNLNRKSKTGTALGTYAYNYTANTNKIATITNSGSAMMGYTYNTIGQMTQQTEVGGQTLNVTYNAYGLTKEVRNASNQLLVSYAYDDRGDRVKKLTYNAGTLVKTTYYVHDAAGNELAIYEQPNPGTLALAEVPIYGAGRLGMYKPASTATFYEINDHLGNVRAVLGPARTETFTATMETEVAAAEDLKFKNIAPRVGWVNATVTPPAPAGNEAVRLSNARIAGPAIILKVAPGDVISAEVYAYYEGCTDCANTLPLASIVNAVTGAFGGVSGGVGEAGKIYTGINGALGSGFGGAAGSSNNAVPAAYLNLITFNNNLDVPNPLELPMAAIPVTTAANWAKQKLTIAPITMTAPGYVYIYINNNSNSASVVHFDDLKVTHIHSPFMSGADFYPFGLTMSDREILTEPYRYGYQGQFAEEDPAMGWNEFESRMYESRFGKWQTPDPAGQFHSSYLGMANNPISAIDTDGEYIYLLGGGKKKLFNYLVKMYNTPKGKEFIDQVLDNPTHHIFIKYGRITDVNNKIVKGVTFSSSDIENNIDQNLTINIQSPLGQTNHSSIFNGEKLDANPLDFWSNTERVDFIAMDPNKHFSDLEMLDTFGHEFGAHATANMSLTEIQQHQIWGTDTSLDFNNLDLTTPAGIYGSQIMNAQIVRLGLTMTSSRIFNIGKLFGRPPMPIIRTPRFRF